MWDVSHGQKAAWRVIQQHIRQRIITTDDFQQPLTLIGGLDISFVEKTSPPQQHGVAALVVLAYPALKVVYEDACAVPLDVPYAAGYLAFRECPAYAQLVEKVKQTPFCPQVFLVDGCGLLHPRGCGSACQLGVEQDIACIGVAKNLLHIPGGLSHNQVQQQLGSMWNARSNENQSQHPPNSKPNMANMTSAESSGARAVVPAAAATTATADPGAHTGTHADQAVDGSNQGRTECSGTSSPGKHYMPGDTSGDTTNQPNSRDNALQEQLNQAVPECCVLCLPGCVADALEADEIDTAKQQKDALEVDTAKQLVDKAEAESHQVLGAALSVSPYQRPVYVSVGHRVSLKTAVQIITKCCKYRIPEPIRQADIRSGVQLRAIL